MYDCIIVGAGPAGGTAAYHLAKRGRSVLILEKASFLAISLAVVECRRKLPSGLILTLVQLSPLKLTRFNIPGRWETQLRQNSKHQSQFGWCDEIYLTISWCNRRKNRVQSCAITLRLQASSFRAIVPQGKLLRIAGKSIQLVIVRLGVI